jgi:GMP synthase-like glutamine amidotransferase
MVANRGDDDAGYVGERLEQRGFALEVFHRDAEGPLEIAGHDIVVLLGSDWSVYWDQVNKQVERESAAVRQAAEADVPVLGICYGGQLMSHALGGAVEKADVSEIGWFDVDSDDDDLAASGLWFEYHVDKFTPPYRAEVFARTSAGPQAYRLGRMVALQFHPEVTPEIIRRWGVAAGQEAVDAGADFEQIARQSDQLAEQSRKRCHALVDGFLDRVAFPLR